MSTPNQRTVQIARWTFIVCLILSAYLALDIVLMARKPAANGGLVVAALACSTSYFRYLKLKRQHGLMFIGDDKPLAPPYNT